MRNRWPSARTRSLLALFLLFGLLWWQRSVRAGEGDIVAQPDGTFTINGKIYQDAPRTQEEYDALYEQLVGASQLICDYTDGLFRLGQLEVVTHPAERDAADIWWFSRFGRATADLGTFGTPAPSACAADADTAPPAPGEGHINLYTVFLNPNDIYVDTADTIAHELGHLVFGLYDRYPDVRATDNPWVRAVGIDGLSLVPDHDGRPIAFFRPVRGGGYLVERPYPSDSPADPDGGPLYPQSGDLGGGRPWWQANNSIMQQSGGQTCVDGAGFTPSQRNPVLWFDTGCRSESDEDPADGIDDDCAGAARRACTTANGTIQLGAACADDAACGPAGDPGVCEIIGFPHCRVGEIPISSELTTALHNELTRFNRTRDEDQPISEPNVEGHVQPAQHLVLAGYLYPSSDDAVNPDGVAGGQPGANAGGDVTCYNRELTEDDSFNLSPAGVCADGGDEGVAPDECNPDIVPGSAEWALQCSSPGRSTTACPGAELAQRECTVASDGNSVGDPCTEDTEDADCGTSGDCDVVRRCTALGDLPFVGMPCFVDEQCGSLGSPGTCDFTAPVSTCATVRTPAVVGDPCADDEDCGTTADPGTCGFLSNTCTAIGGTPALGDICTDNDDCGSASDPGTCFPTGGSCSVLGTSPAIGSRCFIDEECGRPFSPGTCTAHANANFNSSAAVCDGCVIATSQQCNPPFPGLCGNGIVDPPDLTGDQPGFEQCDNGDPSAVLMSCADLSAAEGLSPTMVGGNVRCQANCFYDLSECSLPFMHPEFIDEDDDGHIQLEEAARQSTKWLLAEAFDAQGKVKKPAAVQFAAGFFLNLDEMGPSNHGLFAFFRRVLRYRAAGASGGAWPPPGSTATANLEALSYREVWQLVIAIERAETGGDAFQGIMQEVRRFELEFDVDYIARTSVLRRINGVDWTGSDLDTDWPVVHIGFPATQPQPRDDYSGGSCHFGAACAAVQAMTGAFTREDIGDRSGQPVPVTPPGISLRLDLHRLAVATVEDYLDAGPDHFVPLRETGSGVYAAFGGPVSMYARHGLALAEGAAYEVPQYGQIRYRFPNETPGCANGISDPCCQRCNAFAPGQTPPPACPDAQAQCMADDERAIFFDRFGFNEGTGRYESDQQTLSLLERKYFGAGPRPGYAMETAMGAGLLGANPDQFVDSDWETVDNVMCSQHGIALPAARVKTQGSDVLADQSACAAPPPLQNAAPVEYSEDTQIMLVLDQSGSMATKDTNIDFGIPASRLDYVKNAARNFVAQAINGARLEANDNAQHGPKMGLVWYSDQPEPRIPSKQTAPAEVPCDERSDCPASNICTTLGSNAVCADSTECTAPETCIANRCGVGRCTEPLRFVDSGAIDANTEVGIGAFFGNLMPTDNPDNAPEDPVPGQGITATAGGYTGTGAALSMAEQLFDPVARPAPEGPVPPTKIVLLLSDGGHNRPIGGHCLGPGFCDQIGDYTDPVLRSQCVQPNAACGGAPCEMEDEAPEATCTANGRDPGCSYGEISGCWPTSGADALYQSALDRFGAASPRVLFYKIPLAWEANRVRSNFDDLRTHGETFEAVRNYGEDTIPVFVQAMAATRGQQLARSHIEPPVQIVQFVELSPLYRDFYLIDVEPGARNIQVTVSDYSGSEHPFDPAELQLRKPSGASIPFSAAAESDPNVTFTSEPLVASLSVDSPAESGTWAVQVVKPQAEASRVHYYVAAHVDNPSPVCYAKPSTTVTDGSAPVTIHAQAHYERPVVSDVTYTGYVLGPDQNLVELDFRLDPGTRQHKAVISDFVGSGTYQVQVRCTVGENATTDPGEPQLIAGDFDEIVPPAFTREVTLGFFLDNDQMPRPIPGELGNQQDPDVLETIRARDCSRAVGFASGSGPAFCSVPTSYAPVVPFLDDADGDGILTADEPPIDRDGDGLIAPIDPDDNGTEDFDGEDPDLPEGLGNPTSCGDRSGLDFGPWPMRSYCPSRRSSSNAIGPRAGLVLWEFDTVLHARVRSSPAVGVDGTIYFGADDNRVYALNPNGSQKWAHATGGDVASSPALGRNGLLYVGSDDNKLYALSMATGAVAWTLTTGGDVTSSPVVGADGTVYVGSDDNKVYALDGTTGAVVWSYQTGGDIDSSPAIGANGLLYVGSDDNYVYALERDPGLSAAQRLAWKRYLGLDVEAIPAVGSGDNSFVYVGSEADRMYKLHLDTGVIADSTTGQPDRDVDSSAAIAPDGSIVFGGDNNKVWALNPDLTVKWVYTTGGDVNSSPAIDGEGIVYVGSDDDFLYALRPDAGLTQAQRLLFKVHLGGNVTSSPAIGADGVVYVGSNAGKLFAIVDSGTPGIPPEQNCQSETHDGHVYWFCSSNRSWSDARSRCEDVGISLVTIDDAAENAFVRDRVADDAWIGGTDGQAEGTWQWIANGASFWSGGPTGSPVGGAYANWEWGQPNDVLFDDCAQMREFTGQWTDDPCSEQHDYVCEDPSMTMGVRRSLAADAGKDGGWLSCGIARTAGSGPATGPRLVLIALLLLVAGRLSRRRQRR